MGRPARMLIAALAAALTAAPAVAAPRSVRVEVPGNPGIPRTATPATTQEVTVGGHACDAASPVAALDAVTNHNWTGHWDDAKQDVVITKIGTIDVTTGAPTRKWQLYVGYDSTRKACAAAAEDWEALFYVKCDPPISTGFGGKCYPDWPLFVYRLGQNEWPLDTPLLAAGVPSAFQVKEASGVKDSKPVTTAWISSDEWSGSGTFTPPQDGNVAVRFIEKGPHTVFLSDPTFRRVPDRMQVCASDGSDGYCGTTANPEVPFVPPDVPCEHNGNDGRCGTVDEVGPRSEVTNIKQGQVFRTKKGPTGIRGNTNVALDPAGLKEVTLRLTRVLTQKVKVKPKKRKKKRSARKSSVHSSAAAHVAAKKKKVRYRKVKRCFYWNEGTLLLERAKRCGTAGGRWWVADLSDLRDTFKSDFAMKLPKGTYTLEVQSSDEDGHLDPPEPGRNVIRFVVK